MTVDFTKPILLMPDGSYVVTTKDPVYPYNVLPSDPLWPNVQAWLAVGNAAESYVPPDPVPIDPEAQLSAEIIQDYIETQKQTKKWQDRKLEIAASRSA